MWQKGLILEAVNIDEDDIHIEICLIRWGTTVVLQIAIVELKIEYLEIVLVV